jgi:acyl-coenzyme A thioesterase PaaI-like protein
MKDAAQPPLDVEEALRRWRSDDPKRLVRRGHPVGDFLEAHEWKVLERGPGRIRVHAHLPRQVMNPRGELFGGFTPTYVDFFALHVFHASRGPDEPARWLSTASLRVDYFAPIVGPDFEMLGEVLNRSGSTGYVEVRFQAGARLCAMAQVTLVQKR